MTSSIKQRIQEDIKQAMRNQEKGLLDALRLISAQVKQIEVDERVEVDDTRMLSILEKIVKQTKDAQQQFAQANRDDLVNKAQFELSVVQRYLPEPLSHDQLQKLIEQTIAQVNAQSMKDMAKVMAELKPQIQGRADMGEVSRIIKERLG